jgi:hypothetical protein
VLKLYKSLSELTNRELFRLMKVVSRDVPIRHRYQYRPIPAEKYRYRSISNFPKDSSRPIPISVSAEIDTAVLKLKKLANNYYFLP